MDLMDASCVVYVKVGTFGQLEQSKICVMTATTLGIHQQKTFPSGRNGSGRVDTLRRRRQRHPGGGLLRTRHQYHAFRCISLPDRRFAVSSRSVGHQL